MKGILKTLLAMAIVSSGSISNAYDLENMTLEQIEEMAKQEKTVNFYMWYGQESYNKLADNFKEKYGIQVNVYNADNNATFKKMLAEKGLEEGSVDATIIGGPNIKVAMESDLLYGPILQKLPSAANLNKGLSHSQEGVLVKGFVAPVNLNQTGFAYDPLRLNEADLPQTWEALDQFIQDHPYQFGYNNPNTGGSGQSFIHTMINQLAGGLKQYEGDADVVESKVKDWDKVWNYLNENKAKMTITNSNVDSLMRLNDGELLLVPAWEDDMINNMSKGAITDRLKIYIPEMGMAGGGDTIGIAKNSPHKAAAFLWVNYVTSKEGQQIIADVNGNFPANELAKAQKSLIPQEQKQYAISWFPAAYKALMAEEFTKQVLSK